MRLWKHEHILIAFHQRFGAEPQVLHNQLERYFNVLTPQMYLADNGLRKKFKKSPKVLTNPEIIRILNEGKPDIQRLRNFPKYCGSHGGNVYGLFDKNGLHGNPKDRSANAGLSLAMVHEFETRKPRWWVFFTDPKKCLVRMAADYGAFIHRDIAYTIVLILEFYPTDEKCPEYLNEFIGIDAKSTDMQTLISYFRRALMGLE